MDDSGRAIADDDDGGWLVEGLEKTLNELKAESTLGRLL